MKGYKCLICIWEYDPKIGDQNYGIKPGTKIEDFPENWTCPFCGADKSEFKVIEISN